MKNLYDKFLKYFRVEEILSPQAYEAFKGYSNYFILSRFDPRLLEVMVFIREELDQPIRINDWLWGGPFQERGWRDHLTRIVKNKTKVYFSGHVLGMAFDFDVEDMTAVEVRNWLVKNADRLPHKIRLENLLNGKPISWVHLDVCNEPKNPKVYLFDI